MARATADGIYREFAESVQVSANCGIDLDLPTGQSGPISKPRNQPRLSAWTLIGVARISPPVELERLVSLRAEQRIQCLRLPTSSLRL